MYSRLQLVARYFHYYLTASNGKGHGIHSPFIFEFITRILNDKSIYKDYDKVESLRKRLLADQTIIPVEDFGAGSAVTKKEQRSVSSIARNAAKSKKYGQLLYRVVRFYQPQTILELGTSLGITTSYLALAQPTASIITIEGAKAIADIARRNFHEFSLTNTKLVEGNFDDTLSAVIKDLSSIDLAFIDGNHRQEATENYFNQLLSRTHNTSILVFDDIHWSRGMEQAWESIKNHPSVSCSIDLFFIGLVFFREEFREKQHFRIRF